MHITSIDLNSIIVSKSSSSSTIEWQEDKWSPISFVATFAEMREPPTSWELWVSEESGATQQVKAVDIAIMEGMLCVSQVFWGWGIVRCVSAMYRKVSP